MRIDVKGGIKSLYIKRFYLYENNYVSMKIPCHPFKLINTFINNRYIHTRVYIK